MAKITFALVVYGLVLALACTPVLGQGYSWQSVLDQASQAGISQDTINQAQSAISDGSAQKAAEEALGKDGEEELMGAIFQHAGEMTVKASPSSTQVSPSEAPNDEADDDSDSPANTPENSPRKAPQVAPRKAPIDEADDVSDSPANTPENSPREAPQIAPRKAPQVAPTKPLGVAPKLAPTDAPSAAP